MRQLSPWRRLYNKNRHCGEETVRPETASPRQVGEPDQNTQSEKAPLILNHSIDSLCQVPKFALLPLPAQSSLVSSSGEEEDVDEDVAEDGGLGGASGPREDLPDQQS